MGTRTALAPPRQCNDETLQRPTTMATERGRSLGRVNFPGANGDGSSRRLAESESEESESESERSLEEGSLCSALFRPRRRHGLQ